MTSEGRNLGILILVLWLGGLIGFFARSAQSKPPCPVMRDIQLMPGNCEEGFHGVVVLNANGKGMFAATFACIQDPFSGME